MSQKGDKMESQKHIHSIPKKGRKREKGNEEQMGQVENKQQDSGFKPNRINKLHVNSLNIPRKSKKSDWTNRQDSHIWCLRESTS